METRLETGNGAKSTGLRDNGWISDMIDATLLSCYAVL